MKAQAQPSGTRICYAASAAHGFRLHGVNAAALPGLNAVRAAQRHVAAETVRQVVDCQRCCAARGVQRWSLHRQRRPWTRLLWQRVAVAGPTKHVALDLQGEDTVQSCYWCVGRGTLLRASVLRDSAGVAFCWDAKLRRCCSLKTASIQTLHELLTSYCCLFAIKGAAHDAVTDAVSA